MNECNFIHNRYSFRNFVFFTIQKTIGSPNDINNITTSKLDWTYPDDWDFFF